MENKITLEQALQNISLVCEKFFVGKKEEHIILEKCLELIKNKIKESSEIVTEDKEK